MFFRTSSLLAASFPVFFLFGANCAAAQIRFEVVDIDPRIGEVCYAVTAADVDGDGASDIVAISESAAYWYRNPDWRKFTMVDGVLPRDHVCIAAEDINRDGKIDFAIGAGWPQNGGSIYWIERGAALDQPWLVHEIGAERSTHRMRFADVLGRGEPQLVVSPLNGGDGLGARLQAFPIPLNPGVDPWIPVVLDGSLNRIHNHLHVELEGQLGTSTLTGSQEGISLIQRLPEGGFDLRRLAIGADGEGVVNRGAGEIKMGLFSGNQSILASIEPMHGNQVVVYQVNDASLAEVTSRFVLDDSLNQGHALALADLDGDARLEVVAGFRAPRGVLPAGPGIIVYQASDATGAHWTPLPLDLENMACEDLVCHDFDGDGRMDVVAGGRATHNVRLYLNRSGTEK